MRNSKTIQAQINSVLEAQDLIVDLVDNGDNEALRKYKEMDTQLLALANEYETTVIIEHRQAHCTHPIILSTAKGSKCTSCKGVLV